MWNVELFSNCHTLTVLVFVDAFDDVDDDDVGGLGGLGLSLLF